METNVASGKWVFRTSINLRLGFRIETRGRLIQEDPRRFGQQRTRDRDTLQFSAREALRPVIVPVEPVDQMRQSNVAQQLSKFGAVMVRVRRADR